jgi:soluble lytic murein transglycosylase
MQHRSLPCLAFSVFFTALLCVGCAAQQTEEQALESLRQMTRGGKLPAESAVAPIETRFAGKRTGALARLLRARIRFDNKDFAGAAELLNSDAFAKLTKLADHAHWLRGRALQQTGDHAAAMREFARISSDHAGSIRAADARVLWADSAAKSGSGGRVEAELTFLIADHHAGALLATAKAWEAAGEQQKALTYYRRTYFYGAGTPEAKEAETKLTSLAQPLTPQNEEEILARAENLFEAKSWAEADKAFAELAARYPASLTAAVQLKRIDTLAAVRKMTEAQAAFNAIPDRAPEKEMAYYELATGYARARQWAEARRVAAEMREKFPVGKLTPKAWVDAGLAARDAKIKAEEQYFLGAALANYPNAVEVASAQFELAWMAHEANDLQRSSQMLIEHLARYVDRDTTNRGKAGYWAARDSERAGRTAEACTLYDAVIYRYAANWYGHLAQQRLTAMRGQGKCSNVAAPNELVAKAAANLKTVTVEPEVAGPAELERVAKSDELSTIGLFDWSFEELAEARKTAATSPSINLALARHYRLKGDNVNALLALAKSYPDYSQMFPEEMGREEWDIFYPHVAWDQIVNWSRQRNLDLYQVAGLIRQESVFNPRAASHAKAYGLMQLIVPTAQSVAKKYGQTTPITVEALFQPALNIELGTAYMRDQLDKFGRIEYMAVAYNAGPGRVPQWRATLPAEMDEFVEAIPFRETKGYVQGVIRNTAQYRRLYDERGNFRPEVGSRPIRAAIDSKTREQLTAELPEVVVGTGRVE